MSAPPELVPNPDNCPHFEPNQFKKEKCKTCGRMWWEHKGVIAQELVDGYMSGKKKAADEKAQKEADAKAATKAKAQAKKKATQAVEDDWLADGTAPAPEDDDSDGDMGFRMFSASDFNADKPKTNSFNQQPLKVRNLIDFGECDVPDDESVPNIAASSSSTTAAALPMEAPQEFLADRQTSATSALGNREEPAAAGLGGGPATPPSIVAVNPDIVGDLMSQIEHLRQQLSDSNEEKSIQVEIIQDKVDEKQVIIEDLKTKSREDKAERARLVEQSSGLEQQVANLKTSSEEAMAELTRLREAPVTSADDKLDSLLASRAEEKLTPEDKLNSLLASRAADKASTEAAPSSETLDELAQLRAEVSDLRLFKEKQEAATASTQEAATASTQDAPAQSEWPAEAAALITELFGLCGQTCQTLAEDDESAVAAAAVIAAAAEAVPDSAKPEAALQSLREVFLAAKAGAQRISDERRRLAAKLVEVEASADAAAVAAAAAMTAATALAPTAPTQLQPSPTAASDTSPEVQAAAQAAGRQAAQALREVRLNAERQLAWITKRITMGREASANLKQAI